MITFNNNLPLTFFKVQQSGSMVQYKPYASYYQWIDWFDLAPLDQSADVAAAQAAADAAAAAAADAFTLATDAAAVATDATATAIDALNNAATAQATADAALAAAGAAGDAPVFAVMMDEAVWNITPTRLVTATYPYNYGVFTLTPAAATKKFSAQAGTWDVHILTYKGNNAGQLTVSIDGSTILLNQELYQASPAFSVYNHNLTGVTISASGWHTLQISCSSKHGSSSAFGLLVFKIWGERTGA